MTSMEITRLVVAKILNHVESSVTAIYDRHSYDAEKRRALAPWGDRLDTILAAETQVGGCGNLIRFRPPVRVSFCSYST
jgi:hypothetical protein